MRALENPAGGICIKCSIGDAVDSAEADLHVVQQAFAFAKQQHFDGIGRRSRFTPF